MNDPHAGESHGNTYNRDERWINESLSRLDTTIQTLQEALSVNREKAVTTVILLESLSKDFGEFRDIVRKDMREFQVAISSAKADIKLLNFKSAGFGLVGGGGIVAVAKLISMASTAFSK